MIFLIYLKTKNNFFSLFFNFKNFNSEHVRMLEEKNPMTITFVNFYLFFMIFFYQSTTNKKRRDFLLSSSDSFAFAKKPIESYCAIKTYILLIYYYNFITHISFNTPLLILLLNKNAFNKTLTF